jgi:hypothetical protein
MGNNLSPALSLRRRGYAFPLLCKEGIKGRFEAEYIGRDDAGSVVS